MTINVGLVTSDALVLGCDSFASTTAHYLDPISLPWVTDSDGKFVQDADGKFSLKFDFSDYQSLVTNAWGGVTKMFEIHPAPSPMVAVTAGIAKLNERPIADLAGDFFSVQKERVDKNGDDTLTAADQICGAFLDFMRRKFDEHYKDSGDGFKRLNEPELTHRFTGFGDDVR
jgi:hypothetical protein